MSAADIAGAKKKLRQAEFFLGWLEHASKDPAPQARADPEHLEYWFSACLSAAQSVYYVLEEIGGKDFKAAQSRWRANLPEPERSNFGPMIGMRGQDVHLAMTGAEALPKYVEGDRHRAGSPYYYQHYNAALFGEMPTIEEENPDGTKVRGNLLRGSMGLYVKRQGRYIEVTTACREFIAQLDSLVKAVAGSSRDDERRESGADKCGTETPG
jgi:hypothetical protein